MDAADEPDDSTAHIVDVLPPVAVDAPYSYFAPPGIALAPGDSVKIPLGSREAYGVVWGLHAASGSAPSNLKTILARYDRPSLSDKLRGFIDWLSRYTLAPRGMALRLATRAAEDAGPETTRTLYRLAGPPPERMTPARARVIAAAEGGLAFAKKALSEAAGVSSGVIDALVDEGTLATVAAPPEPVAAALDALFDAPRLEPEQQTAANELTRAVAERAFRPFLLEGVTGSGKTEVYFEAVASALQSGGQALVLMPEIALTAQFLERFAARFGAKPAEWHSGVSPRKRARIWRGAATGEVKVVAGARSALFLPFCDLRLIVVDEEHEAAYKQEDGVSYHARDMAIVRARFENACVVLASATPSIETRVNAARGRYGHLRLSARANARLMPRLEAIDMRVEGPERGRWIAPRLALAMGEAIANGEQTLLFLNRRGYAPLTLVPHVWSSLPLRELRRLARRASLPPRARLSSLRPCRAAPECLPGMRKRRFAHGLRTGRRASRGRSRDAVPRCAPLGALLRFSRRRRAAAARIGRDRQRRLRHCDRHAACGEGS